MLPGDNSYLSYHWSRVTESGQRSTVKGGLFRIHPGVRDSNPRPPECKRNWYQLGYGTFRCPLRRTRRLSSRSSYFPEKSISSSDSQVRRIPFFIQFSPTIFRFPGAGEFARPMGIKRFSKAWKSPQLSCVRSIRHLRCVVDFV